jgi:hypothetical protein
MSAVRWQRCGRCGMWYTGGHTCPWVLGRYLEKQGDRYALRMDKLNPTEAGMEVPETA